MDGLATRLGSQLLLSLEFLTQQHKSVDFIEDW
jgi:hypothetical protein